MTEVLRCIKLWRSECDTRNDAIGTKGGIKKNITFFSNVAAWQWASEPEPAFLWTAAAGVYF